MTTQRSGTPLYIHIIHRRLEAARAWSLGNQGGGRRRALSWLPPVDVFETPDGGLVRVEVAGMDENDFDVVLEDRALVIAGNRREPTSLSRRQCHRKEIASGYFRCEVEIAWPVDADRVEARYQDGFLTIALPRRGWTDDV